jgi:L-asparaginase
VGTLRVLGCGGTITSTVGESGARSGHGPVGSLVSGAEIDGYDIDFADVTSIPSRAMTPALMLQLARQVLKAERSGAAGVVITHGTDTLEETAYALSAMVQSSIPVVLTGAMRGADEPGADGQANLRDALLVAASPSFTSFGPVVSIAGEVHDPRWVTKSDTSRISAFTSPGAGPVGGVTEGVASVWSSAPEAPRSAYLGLPSDLTTRVELIWSAAGMDGFLISAASGASDGLVIAGTGGGHLPPAAATAAKDAAQGIPVVLASRCGTGATLASTYGGAGSETDLLAHGLLRAGRLTPVKARLRLMIILALGLDPSRHFPVL